MLWDWKSITGEKTVKTTNTWRLNSALLNNQEITEEIKEEIKKYIETRTSAVAGIPEPRRSIWVTRHLLFGQWRAGLAMVCRPRR